MGRVQHGVSLNQKLWDMLKAIERKTGEKYSGYVERLISEPVRKRFEELGLGKCDKYGLDTHQEVGYIVDDVSASSFAAYGIESHRKAIKHWNEQCKIGWRSKEERDMEIELSEMRLKRSSDLRVANDWKKYRVLKKVERNVEKAIYQLEHGAKETTVLGWLDKRFDLKTTRQFARKRLEERLLATRSDKLKQEQR
jgi:hypothetical protein